MPRRATVLDRGGLAARARSVALEATLTAASIHRRRRRNVRFIGVTGSCGKTTTKLLLSAILGRELPGRVTPGNRNQLRAVAGTVLRTTGSDAFCLVEVAAWRPGSVERAARVLRPHIAIVTAIGTDHRKALGTVDAIAAEKRALVDAVVPGGVAVLNADDPRVMAMAGRCRGRVITVGTAPGADLRADDVRSRWPERLSFTLRRGGRSHGVHTRLCGTHWVPSVLAALAAASEMGVSLGGAIEAIADVEPYPGRMSPVECGGVWFIRDDQKAPLWAIDAPLNFLAEARARRKLVVIGTISDYAGTARIKYRNVAEQALAGADEVLFVGGHAHHALAARTGRGTRTPRAYPDLAGAATFLRRSLAEGDLVLLKGSRADRLDSLVGVNVDPSPGRGPTGCGSLTSGGWSPVP